MALPSSGPISGSQIATELDVGAVNLSLIGMFASSSFAETPIPMSYSDFYGYASRVEVLRANNTITKPALACNLDFGYATSVWFVKNIGAEIIEVGNYCYTSETGDTVLANGNYAIGVGVNAKPFYVITIANGTGYVSAVFTCE